MRFAILQAGVGSDFPRRLVSLEDVKEIAFAEHWVGRYNTADIYATRLEDFFRRLAELSEVGDKKFTIRAQKFSNLKTIHTIGDAPEEFDTEAMEEVFPSYTHTLWSVK